MVGRVRVRGQGPVRRGQTTTTFKKGGRVKLMHGGRPSARTRHIENEKEEIRRVDRNIRRNEGYKTGGRVKKVKGGMMTPGMKKAVRTMMADWDDSGKRLSPHQDPRSKMSAELRHMRDNPPKKKTIHSPHADKKKRTLRDMYPRSMPKPRKRTLDKYRKRTAPRAALPAGTRRKMKATGGEAKKTTPRMMGRAMPKSPTARKSRVMIADTDFHKRKRAAAKDKGKPNTPGEKRRTLQGMYNAGQARNKKFFRGEFDVGKQMRKKRKHHDQT